jgi:TonB family protein
VAEGVFSDSIWHWNVVVAEFEAPKGLYSMDIEPPAACMVDAPEYPRLNVEVDWQATGLDNKADLLFYILAALGITLLLWPDVRETEGLSLQGETRATYRGMARVGRCLQPLIAFTKPLSSLRMFSYMAVTGIALIYWFWAVATPLTPRGLMVYVPKPGTYLLADEPWNQPLVVRVDALGNLYLNRHPVLFADLGARLEKALSLRADWAVFVDADPDVNAGAVIAVVDLVHGIGGTKVLLVTPSMKKEKPQLAAIRPCGAQPLQTGMLKPMPKWNQDASKVLSHYPIVSFTVGERGEVSNIKLRRSSGIREIDEWVVDSMRKWRYKPTPGCDEIESKVEFSIHFY